MEKPWEIIGSLQAEIGEIQNHLLEGLVTNIEWLNKITYEILVFNNHIHDHVAAGEPLYFACTRDMYTGTMLNEQYDIMALKRAKIWAHDLGCGDVFVYCLQPHLRELGLIRKGEIIL